MVVRNRHKDNYFKGKQSLICMLVKVEEQLE